MHYVKKHRKYPYCAMCGVEYDSVSSASRCCKHLWDRFYYEKDNEITTYPPPGNYTDEQILSVIEETISTHPTLKHKGFLINWLKNRIPKKAQALGTQGLFTKKLTKF